MDATKAKHTIIHAGKDRYGAYLMIGDFRSAMPSAEVATQLSAAPELLEALEQIVESYEKTRGEVMGECVRAAEAAIRKAKGE